MTKSEQLAHRLKEGIAHTNYNDQLEGVDWKTATTKFQSLNTLALLAQHVHCYIKGIMGVFEMGKLEIRDQYSFDFPPIGSQQDWQVFLDKFWGDTKQLAGYIEKMPDDKWNQDFVD
jgi:hypothetical protein